MVTHSRTGYWMPRLGNLGPGSRLEEVLAVALASDSLELAIQQGRKSMLPMSSAIRGLGSTHCTGYCSRKQALPIPLEVKYHLDLASQRCPQSHVPVGAVKLCHHCPPLGTDLPDVIEWIGVAGAGDLGLEPLALGAIFLEDEHSFGDAVDYIVQATCNSHKVS
jgi:hypothetical protein